MKRSPLLSLMLLLGAATVWAAQTSPRFKDTAGNMELYYSSWFQRFKKDSMEFVATGSPVRGSWRAQGLAVSGAKIQGRAVKNAKNGYDLDSASISGSVKVTVRKGDKAGESRTTELRSASVTIDAKSNSSEIKLISGFEIISALAGGKANQVIRMEGSSGTAIMAKDGNGNMDLSRASVRGPVKLRLSTRDGKGTSVFTGEGDSMTYDAATRVIEMKGNVTLTGDTDSFSGSATANRATITLTAAGEIDSVELVDSPGKATVQEKPKP